MTWCFREGLVSRVAPSFPNFLPGVSVAVPDRDLLSRGNISSLEITLATLPTLRCYLVPNSGGSTDLS